MNAQNAQSIGYEDGKTYISGFLANREMTFAEASKLMDLEFITLQAARNVAEHTYRVQSKRTVDLYVQGAHDAWEACVATSQREAEESARRAAVEHNPNTRFCTCAACSGKGE
jgi:hypothetical protein